MDIATESTMVKSSAVRSWQESAFGRAATRLLRDRLALLGLVVTAAMMLVAVFAPVLTPYDPLALDLPMRFASPSRQHLLGADEFGRDILSRMIVASRISVLGSMVAIVVATVTGVPWGLISGFFRGRIDVLLMRVIDFLLATPTILLAMVILGVLGPSSINAMIAIAVTNFPSFARLTRASTLVENEKDYVLASRSMGASNIRLLFKVILPNCMPPILVQITISLAYAVLLESALSFLGLGTQPPDPSWGYMLSMGRYHLRESPWYGIFPGVAITSFVLALSFLSDGLRAALSPGEAHR